MEIFLFWTVSVVFGWMIGGLKGRAFDGFAWSFLLGPLGVIITLCLPNLAKEKKETERSSQMAYQIKLQEAQLKKLCEIQNNPPVHSFPQTDRNLRIASGGIDLGEMPPATVKAMLQSGKLSLQDHYFDRDANEWMPLDCCVAIF